MDTDTTQTVEEHLDRHDDDLAAAQPVPTRSVLEADLLTPRVIGREANLAELEAARVGRVLDAEDRRTLRWLASWDPRRSRGWSGCCVWPRRRPWRLEPS